MVRLEILDRQEFPRGIEDLHSSMVRLEILSTNLGEEVKARFTFQYG